MQIKLTENFAKSVKATDKRDTYSDNGLILEVNPSGKKVFYHKFRQDGIQRKSKLGDYPAISVKEAKNIALSAKHDIQIKGIKQPILEVTFGQFIEGEYKEWLFANNKAAGDSYATINAHFVPLLGHIKIKNIVPLTIEGWKNKRLNSGISAATVTRNLTELRSIFSRVEDWYKLPSFMPSVKNPKITVEKEKLYLSDEEVRRLKDTCDHYTFLYHFGDSTNIPEDWGIQSAKKIPIMLVYIIHLAINSGLRKGEILQLLVSDVDEETKIINVRGSTEKTSRFRDIPISNKLAVELSEWASMYYGENYDINPNSPLFPIKSITTGWNTFRKRAGLEHVEFRTLRHHFASSLVLKGVALSTVMKLMGHTNIKTTQRYLSVRTEDKFDAVNLL